MNTITLHKNWKIWQDLRHTIKQKSPEEYWHLDLMNETLFNSGKSVNDGIDQIRSYLLLGYTRPELTISGGYHQRYIPQSGKNWIMRHGLTIWVTQSLSLLKNN